VTTESPQTILDPSRAAGLLYDAMGWTEEAVLKRNLQALRKAVRLISAPRGTERETLLSLRRLLQEAGIRTSPPIED
jgi:hypothetical protein